MGYFSGVESAKAASSPLYVEPGEAYESKILCAKIVDSPQSGCKNAIVEYEVLSASDDAKNRPGSKPAHCIQMKGLYWLGEIKALVAAVAQVDPAKVTEAVVESFFGPSNPAMGKTVRYSARTKMTRQNKPFTKVEYFNPALVK